MSTSTGLQVNGVGVSYGALRALSDVTIDFGSSGRIGLVGPNGAGKTTLLNAISGFVRPTTGSVFLNGQDVTATTVQQRVGMGLIRTFQTARLLEDETVEKNVLLGCHLEGSPGGIRQMLGLRAARKWEREMRERSAAVIDTMRLRQYSSQVVSGLPSATRRLVEVARVLVSDPSVVLLDEPAAGLDASERAQLGDVLLAVSEERDLLMVLVEHDVSIVRRVCQQVHVLAEGRQLAAGATDEVLALPSVRSAYFGEVPSAAG